MMKSILVAIDGSDHAQKALEHAVACAQKFDATLTFVHVLMHGRNVGELERMAGAEHLADHARQTVFPTMATAPVGMASVFNVVEQDADHARIVAAIGDRLAEDAVNTARDAGVEAVDSRVVSGDFAEAIVDAAVDTGADLVVMGSRGLGRIQKLLMGSVSQKVCQAAPCSVMVVK